MPGWVIHGHQGWSDRLSSTATAGDLGTAVFRVIEHPAPTETGPGEGGAWPLRVLERDRGLTDRLLESDGARRARGRAWRRARGRGEAPPRAEEVDDELGTITARVTGAGPADVGFDDALSGGADEGPQVTIVLLRATDDLERDAAAGQRWTVRVPPAAIEDDHDPYLEFGLLGPEQDWDAHPPVRLRAHPGGEHMEFAPDPPVTAAREWDQRAAPQERAGEAEDGPTQQLHGRDWVFRDRGSYASQPHVLVGSDAYLWVRRYHVSGTSRDWGIFYGGRNEGDCLNRAMAPLGQEYEDANDLFRAHVARGFELLGEGAVSSINTWDSKVVTLGAGFAGGRLNGVTGALPAATGDLLAEVLDPLPGFSGHQNDHETRFRSSEQKWSDEAREARLAVPVFARYVRLTEDRVHCHPWAVANLREFVTGSGVGTGGADVAGANEELAAHGRQPQHRALCAMAAYLRHGSSAFQPSPPRDVRTALRHTRDASLQLMTLFKLHAQRITTVRASERVKIQRAEICLSRAFGVKIKHFEEGYNADREGSGPAWQFEFESVPADFVPCLVRARPTSWRSADQLWTGSATAPAGDRIVLRAFGKYYDFGEPLDQD